MAKTANDFFNSYNGKVIDIDHAYGVQCVDGFKAFCIWAFGTSFPTGNGYADGYWYNRAQHSDQFIAVDKKDIHTGDWVIWAKGSKSHPASHIAMYYNGQEFGENQGGNRGFCLKDTDFSDALGGIRWKGFPQPATKPTPAPTANIDQMARDVIAGKYGNGDQRKKALGANYNAVQARVNQILSGGKAPVPSAPLRVGDKVKVTRAVDYNGRSFKTWYSTYTVMELKGNRAVIGVNGTVTAAINTANIRKA